eukprot:gene980-2600_t
MSYFEGTRMKEAKLQESQEFAQKRNKPILQNVLLPKSNGFSAAVLALRDGFLDAVVDLTLCYGARDGTWAAKPSLWEVHMFPNRRYRWHIHVRRYTILDLPADSDDLGEWLMERWVEKDCYRAKLRADWKQ